VVVAEAGAALSLVEAGVFVWRKKEGGCGLLTSSSAEGVVSLSADAGTLAAAFLADFFSWNTCLAIASLAPGGVVACRVSFTRVMFMSPEKLTDTLLRLRLEADLRADRFGFIALFLPPILAERGVGAAAATTTPTGSAGTASFSSSASAAAAATNTAISPSFACFWAAAESWARFLRAVADSCAARASLTFLTSGGVEHASASTL